MNVLRGVVAVVCFWAAIGAIGAAVFMWRELAVVVLLAFLITAGVFAFGAYDDEPCDY